MIDINFSNIRPFDGSKNSGFEELVCQLAHLKRPENAKKFIRKEGAGGDAGVECYWILEGGCEIGWQAKYFLNEMTPSRWTQLDTSFKAALSKHPNLDTYIVCLPIDKTDSRKPGPSGKQVKSLEDKWQQRVTKWKSLGQKKGRSINFCFWGKHEITSMLTIDDPLYSGRLLYWFNEPVLNTEGLRDIAQKSKDTLGDRFTPEFHVDLPIAKQFDGLCANENWWSEISSHISEIKEKYSNFTGCISDENFEASSPIDITEFQDKYSKLITQLSDWIKSKAVDFDLTDLKTLPDSVYDGCRKIYKLVEEKEFKDKDLNRSFQRIARDFYSALRDIEEYLHSKLNFQQKSSRIRL